MFNYFSPFGDWTWERDVNSLRREINRLFGEYDGALSERAFPPVNIWTMPIMLFDCCLKNAAMAWPSMPGVGTWTPSR